MIARILLAALPLAACSPGADTAVDALEEAEGLPVQIMFQGLCDSRAAAESGDVVGASATFESRVHAELHTFADRLAAADRDVAARLLEAKQRVEASFAAGDAAQPAEIASQLTILEGEVATGAEALGLERPTCGGGA